MGLPIERGSAAALHCCKGGAPGKGPTLGDKIAWAWPVLVIAYFGAVVLQRPGIYDEGLIVSGAARILHGQLPYRDFNTGYPPGQFYTIAAVFRVFGETLLAARIWDLLWRVAIVGLAFALARKLAIQRPHRLPLACIVFFTGAAGFCMYPMISGVLFCVAALWCAVLYFQGRGMRWLLFSGLVAGAGLLYRHDLLACVCAAVTLTVSYYARKEPNAAWLKAPAVFVTGVVAVAAPFVLFFWSSVPHVLLKQSFIDFPRMVAAARHLPLPPPSSIWLWQSFYLPFAILILAAVRLRWTAKAQRPVLLLLLLATGLTLALATQRLDRWHAYPAILLSLVLLSCVLGAIQLENRSIVTRICSAAFICGVLICYGVMPLVFWRSVVVDILNDPRAGIAHAGPVRLRQDQQEAIRYIRQHLPPGRPLYVGTTTHSQQFNNDTLFYFLADRPQITRFDMFVPGFTDSSEVQSEIARSIERNSVEYVVLLAVPLSHEPNLSSVDSGVTLLDDAIRQNYAEVARFGAYTICHRIKSVNSQAYATVGVTPE